MAFKPPFEIGAVVSNAVMAEAFKVGNMGGMRRSKTTHYTGMGKIGDQAIDRTQNKTLAESKENGVEVHLFEVNEPGKYTYSGVVELAGKPYQETQPDDNGNSRKVWMFPLKKKTAVSVTSEPKKDVITEPVQELVEEKHFDPSTVKTETTVYHNKFGTGTVRKIESEIVYVEFGCGMRIFVYPDAFEKGWLTL